MTERKVLVSECDRFSSEAAEILSGIADVSFRDLNRAELLDSVEEFEVLWVRLRHQIDRQVLEQGPNLKFICSPTTGLNHIDLDEADRRGIRVLSLRGEVDFLREIRATAEHTIGLMLSLLRKLPAAIDHVNHGGWDRDPFCGGELHRKTIGVVGFGRLGRLVARYASAFDARVLVADPNVDQDQIPDAVKKVSIETLLGMSDIVTLHVNLCDATSGFFGKDHFALMKENTWFINTSRGELVDETALLESLTSGRLRGAALDVLSGERATGMGDHPLVRYANQHSNLLITPHIGGCTAESMAKTEIFLAEKLCAALQESSVKA